MWPCDCTSFCSLEHFLSKAVVHTGADGHGLAATTDKPRQGGAWLVPTASSPRPPHPTPAPGTPTNPNPIGSRRRLRRVATATLPLAEVKESLTRAVAPAVCCGPGGVHSLLEIDARTRGAQGCRAAVVLWPPPPRIPRWGGQQAAGVGLPRLRGALPQHPQPLPAPARERGPDSGNDGDMGSWGGGGGSGG